MQDKKSTAIAKPTEEAHTNQLSSNPRLEHFGERTRNAYLLHMWAEPHRPDRKPLWRFRLEEVETGVRHGFGNLDTLVEFLQARITESTANGSVYD